MAQTPNTIIFQEYDTLTVIPDDPELNVVVVGPCYQILDYVDDKALCAAGEYGALQANCPAVDPTAVIIATLPSAKPGAVLVAEDTSVYLDDVRAIVAESAAGSGTPDKATYLADGNLLVAHTNAAGAHFAALGVVAGDTLLVNSSNSLVGGSDFIAKVKEVIFAIDDFDAALGLYANAVQAGDRFTIASDVPPGGTPRDGIYTIKRVRSNRVVEFTGLAWTGNFENSFAPTNICNVTISSANGAVKVSAAGVQLADYSELRLTSDFTENSPANANWRIERALTDVKLSASDFSILGNQITLDAAITTDISSTLIGKKISFGSIYVQYRALRTDLQLLNTVNDFASGKALMGKYDARNPLFVGAVVAKANTATTVKAYGLASDNYEGYLDFISKVSSEKAIYAIVPLTYSASVLAALNNTSLSLSDPNYVLSKGIKQKFRITIGAVELPLEKELIVSKSGGSASTEPNTAPAAVKLGTLAVVGATAPNFSALGVVPGDEITLFNGTTTVNYTVAHLNAALVVETDQVISTLTTAVETAYFRIRSQNGLVTKYLVTVGEAPGNCESFSFTGSNLDNLHLIFSASNAGFITNGCIPGDILQIPSNPTVGNWATLLQFTIDEILSESRIRIMNNGTDTSSVANELPHQYKRADGSAILAGSVYYKVVRNLSKDQQVNEMISVATSFGSHRTILAYPSSVDVADLVDGSIVPRSVATKPEAATSQPGYYLSCLIGGMIAGKPSHQGFTNMGGAGIKRIYGSNGYFEEEQLSDLSNGGVYVFTQETPNSLPLSMHALTTDTSALEFSELMFVKNYDYIAMTFLDTMSSFVGPWNVNPETIEFVKQALFSTGDNLKSKYTAKIGAPLLSYNLEYADVSTLSSDRIESKLKVKMPMVLNTLAIHLVS